MTTREDRHLEVLLRALAESAKVEPPPELDARIRAALASSPTHAPPLPSLVTTSALALGAYTAVVLAAGIVLADGGLGAAAPMLSLALATGYLIVCSAASLPLLLRRWPLRRVAMHEGRP